MVKIPIKRILRNRKAGSGMGAAIFSFCFGLLDLGLSMTGIVNSLLGWILAGIAVLGMLIGAFLFMSGRSSVYRELLINEKGAEIKQIPETLTLMHQRIRQLRDELANTDIGREKAARLQKKMNKFFPLSESQMNRVHEWQKSDNPKRIRSFIWFVETYNRLFIGSVYGSRYVNFMCDIGGMLETEDVGLRPILKTDVEYKQLKDKLEMQYAGVPRNISKPIFKYQRYLYGFSSTILWDNYRIKYLGRQLPTVVETRIVQFEQIEDTIMDRLKEDVIRAINKYLG